jgi:hypothetical protein
MNVQRQSRERCSGRQLKPGCMRDPQECFTDTGSAESVGRTQAARRRTLWQTAIGQSQYSGLRIQCNGGACSRIIGGSIEAAVGQGNLL